MLDQDLQTVQWDKLKPVYAFPINSGIGFPVEGQKVELNSIGTVDIKGWAHGDGADGT